MNREIRPCDGIRELILEADPAELRGVGESPLAVHLRGCAGCAADAERVLAAQRSLADALADLTAGAARPPAIAAVAAGAARRPALVQERQHGSRTWRARAARGRSRTWILGAAPLAAVAVLALLLVQLQEADERLPLEPVTGQVAVADDGPVVNVTTAHDVAIMKTADPNITVVWYLKRER